MTVIALAAGGSAGHVEPALAVAHWVKENHSDVECLFIGSTSGLENSLVPAAGFSLTRIKKLPMPRKISLRLLSWPFELVQVFGQATKALKGADVLVGFGGYVSAPCYLAAFVRRIPIIIHEQNAKVGWANKLGSVFTNDIGVAFHAAQAGNAKWRNAKYVGMPLRSSIIDVAQMNTDQRKVIRNRVCSELGLNPSQPLVLVFGGSQGAQRINETIRGVTNDFAARGIQIIHGVGRGNVFQPGTATYSPHEYLENMADLYASADLVIARSGAVTCAELLAIQVYSLLIPLPFGNGEQKANAVDLIELQLAETLDNSHITSQWLIENIAHLLEMGQKISSRRVPRTPVESARLIAEMAMNANHSDGGH